MDILKNTDIKFVSFRKKSYLLSGLVILVGIISILAQGFNYGIDFAGGTLLQLEFNQKNVTVAEIRGALGEINLAGSTIQSLSNDEFVIRTTQTELQERQKILNAIENRIGPFQVLRVEMVGPVIGESLKSLTVLAIIFAFIGIIIYITVRFQFLYAITAILALAHDVLITLGVLSILQKEVTIPIVAAILTIVGYSINNTIVIFDRLRENLKSNIRISMENVINLSINQSLTRTIYTALTTLLPLFALYFFGGTLSDFALVLLVGISVGTFSSICIAGPMLLDFKKRFKISGKKVSSAPQREQEKELKAIKKVKKAKTK